MSDLNKTTLTQDVTAAMALWMECKGFKPIETEVPVSKGWCADLAAVLVPTQTELIDLKLLPRQPSWNERFSRDPSVKRREWGEARWEDWQHQRNALAYQTYTAVVEVKTSRGDFLGDRKWMSAVPADMAFLAFPAGLVKEHEYPRGWGIVSVGEDCARMQRPPSVKRVADFQRAEVINSIAVRRDHHTRYERHREWQRDQRDRENERKTLARAVTMILRGEHGSVEGAIERVFTLRKLPSSAIEQLRPFFAMRPRTEGELAAERAEHEASRLLWEARRLERRTRVDALEAAG